MTIVVKSSQFAICSPQTPICYHIRMYSRGNSMSALVLHSLLKVNEKIAQPHVKLSEIVIDLKSRIDVKDIGNSKMIKSADKKVKKGGKKRNSDENKEKINQEKAAKLKAEEEERLRKWEEDWDKKLKAQEALEDKTCCMSKGLCLRPKTQSNIWINITEGKTIQDIQLYFKHVPVPKPKAPPLPKLKREEEPTEAAPTMEKKRKKAGKKFATKN